MKVEALALKKDCEIAGEWVKSLVNHLYRCVASTPDGNGDMIIAKRLSVVNHIHNKHSCHSSIFPNVYFVLYIDKRNGLSQVRNYFLYLYIRNMYTIVRDKPTRLIKNIHLCNSIKKLSHCYQMSSVESFHSIILHFAPKHTSFSNEGMIFRSVYNHLVYLQTFN